MTYAVINLRSRDFKKQHLAFKKFIIFHDIKHYYNSRQLTLLLHSYDSPIIFYDRLLLQFATRFITILDRYYNLQQNTLFGR